jgi:hypothetical protein
MRKNNRQQYSMKPKIPYLTIPHDTSPLKLMELTPEKYSEIKAASEKIYEYLYYKRRLIEININKNEYLNTIDQYQSIYNQSIEAPIDFDFKEEAYINLNRCFNNFVASLDSFIEHCEDKENYMSIGVSVRTTKFAARNNGIGVRQESNPQSPTAYSSVRYPKMMDVRNDLKAIITSCQIGLVLLPIEQRQNIGIETFKGLKKILDSNDFGKDIEIYVDENYFKSKKIGEEFGQKIGLDNYELFLEVDSIKVKGIQIADLVAHTFATMLLEQLGLIDKKVKAGENSGYDPDLEIELGFELWASIRYSMIGKVDMERFEVGDGQPIKLTEPYGFYISSFCDENLQKNGKERFGEIYLGCIH